MRPLSTHAFLSTSQSVETLRTSLSAAGWPSVVELGDVRAALQDAHHWPALPDVIFLDVSMEADQIAAVREFADNAPQGEADIVIIGRGNDIKTFRAFKELGAFEYIPSPVDKEDIEATIALLRRTAAARKSLPDPSKIITVASTRGGAGGSTVAAELARGISGRHGKKVLLLDLDLESGCQYSILSADPTPGFDLMLEKPDTVDALLFARTIARTNNPNLMLLSDAMHDVSERFKPTAAAELVSSLARHVDYVVVDVPARSSFLRDLALISQTLVVLTVPVFNGLRDTVSVLDRIEKWGVGAIKDTFVLVNRQGELKTGTVSLQAFKEEVAKGGKPEYRSGIQVFGLPYAPRIAIRSAHTAEAIANDQGPLGKAVSAMIDLMPSAPHKPLVRTFFSTLFGTRS